MKRASKKPYVHLDGPLLDTIQVDLSKVTHQNQYPFNVPLVKNLKKITFPTNVTFFVGENGSGKSTLLEAFATNIGFGPEGGSKNIAFKTSEEETYTGAQLLSECFTFSWRLKPKDGYFFRAESFFNIANHLDEIARTCGGPEITFQSYGGKSLHKQSHGESFLAFFQNRVGKGGFFIFDEPEAALSPQRQLALLRIINQLSTTSNAQFIIATHSPLLLAYPNATIYSCDSTKLEQLEYTQTKHYEITKSFLDDPQRYLHYLFNEHS